jgi:hypothetical protein
MMVRLTVIRAMPPRTAAAPTKAYVLLKARLGYNLRAKFPNKRPNAAPDSRLGTKSPDGTAMPYTRTAMEMYGTKKRNKADS